MKVKFKSILTIFNNVFPISNELLEREFEENELGCAFGCALKALRGHKNLTLKQLSTEIDIPFQTINRYENGVNIPTITQAVKIVDFFNLPLEMFLILGLAGTYENADMAKEYDKFQSQLKEAQRRTVINRAKGKK